MQSASTVVVLGTLAGVFVAAVWVAVTNLRRTDEPPPRSRSIGKVVAGPMLRDGVWCRLVAFEDGQRLVEILGPNGWAPSHRDIARLLQAMPGRSTGERPKT